MEKKAGCSAGVYLHIRPKSCTLYNNVSIIQTTTLAGSFCQGEKAVIGPRIVTKKLADRQTDRQTDKKIIKGLMVPLNTYYLS